MKEHILAHKAIKIPIFHNILYVFIGDRNEATKLAKSKYNANLQVKESAGGFVATYDDWGVLLYVDDTCGDNIYGLLAHEVTHATGEILRAVGIEHTKETEEIYSYMQQFIFEEIVKLLKLKDSK